jgi:hypothetical protein
MSSRYNQAPAERDQRLSYPIFIATDFDERAPASNEGPSNNWLGSNCCSISPCPANVPYTSGRPRSYSSVPFDAAPIDVRSDDRDPSSPRFPQQHCPQPCPGQWHPVQLQDSSRPQAHSGSISQTKGPLLHPYHPRGYVSRDGTLRLRHHRQTPNHWSQQPHPYHAHCATKQHSA